MVRGREPLGGRPSMRLSGGPLPRLPFGDQRAGALARTWRYLHQVPITFRFLDHESDAARNALAIVNSLDADAAAAQFPGEEGFAVFLLEQLRRGDDQRRSVPDLLAELAQLRGVGGWADGRVGESEERADARSADE